MLHGAKRGLAQQQAVGGEQLKHPAGRGWLASDHVLVRPLVAGGRQDEEVVSAYAGAAHAWPATC